MTRLQQLLIDDRGQDLIEYVLLGATVALTSLVLMNVFPGVMNAVYVSWENATQDLWYPQAPTK
jgi:Flp pilus assembly pilin Flp